MKDYKELICKIRGAAARWEEEHPIVGVGQMRYCDALRDAADAIEQLVKERDEWKTLGEFANKRAEDYREMRRQRDKAIKERDAAIAALCNAVDDHCEICKHDGDEAFCERGCRFEWRGVQEVEHG